MRTESRAVMLTDMKGFTAATLRQTRGENARMLALHDALVLPLVTAFGGVRVKTIGDAYLVIFQAPTEALACGMAIQDRLWDYNQRVPGTERMELRVAVAFGEVRIVKTHGGLDVFGDAVNLAARVEGEAPPGDIWFTEAVRCVADQRSIPFQEMGRRKLKGLPDEVRLFRVWRAHPYDRDAPAGPPYRNAALGLVRWLPPPEPAWLARLGLPAQPDARWRIRLVIRALALALFVALAAAGGLWVWRSRPKGPVRQGLHPRPRAALLLPAMERGSESLVLSRDRIRNARPTA